MMPNDKKQNANSLDHIDEKATCYWFCATSNGDRSSLWRAPNFSRFYAREKWRCWFRLRIHYESLHYTRISKQSPQPCRLRRSICFPDAAPKQTAIFATTPRSVHLHLSLPLHSIISFAAVLLAVCLRVLLQLLVAVLDDCAPQMLQSVLLKGSNVQFSLPVSFKRIQRAMTTLVKSLFHIQHTSAQN